MRMDEVVLVPLKSGGFANVIYPPRFRVLQWNRHLMYWKNKKATIEMCIFIDELILYIFVK